MKTIFVSGLSHQDGEHALRLVLSSKVLAELLFASLLTLTEKPGTTTLSIQLHGIIEEAHAEPPFAVPLVLNDSSRI